jgi:hypothetical protein
MTEKKTQNMSVSTAKFGKRDARPCGKSFGDTKEELGTLLAQ